jgi:predicted ATPase
MLDDFRTTELDPDLLATPFGVQTNWHVITGAACSGKTTLIKQLAGEGYQIVPETAREYFEREIARGRTIDEIREDGKAIQLGIFDLQLRVEQGLLPSQANFLDRALPDSLTFHRIFGINPNEILRECFNFRYASVFILDRLPFLRSQALGPEDDTSSFFLDDWLARDYLTLGYPIVRVPVLSPEERLAFVLEKLSEQGLIQQLG